MNDDSSGAANGLFVFRGGRGGTTVALVRFHESDYYRANVAVAIPFDAHPMREEEAW